MLWLNYHGPRSTTAGFGLGIPAKVWWLTQAKALWMYAKLVVWPWPLSIHYEFPYLTSLAEAWPWVVSAVLVGIGTLVLLWRRAAVGFVLATVLIILSPTLVIPIITEVAAERRMYLPLAAIITLVVTGGYWIAQQSEDRSAAAGAQRSSTVSSGERLAVAGGLLLATLLGAISFERLAVYHDDLTLWQDVLNSQPNDYLAHFNLGNALSRADRLRDAVQQYQIAVQLQPSYVDAHNNLGLAYGKLGKAPAAIEQFQLAVEYKPTYVQGWANMALAYAAANHPEQAVALAQKAIEMARSNGQTRLAGEIEAWLTNYRASLSNQK